MGGNEWVRRSWRVLVVFVAAAIAAVAVAIAGISLNTATGGEAPWFPSMDQHYLWWLAGSTAAVAGSGLSGWWTQRWYDRGLAVLVPVVQRPESWVVDRPTELGQIVRALRRSGSATVGITTAVHGAGGFGKTTVARLVRSDRRVLRRYGGRVYWVTLGRDIRWAALVEKVNDLVRQVSPERAQPFTDVRQAAEHLAAVLANGPRRLVILDDVWFDDQLAAFPVAGRCARLVTTRIHSLVVGASVPVKVDRMSQDQARRLVVAGLEPPPPPVVVNGLVLECGRWPLLLRLINKIMVDQMRSRTDVAAVAHELLKQLRHHGAMQVDELTGAALRQLDLNDPDQRDDAVAATIEASTGLLTTDEHARFTELAIFAEDETIPVALVSALWRSTSGMTLLASGALCARLADLALLNLAATDDGGTISMHDVVRDYLHHRLGPAKVASLHRTLLEALAADLPQASSALSEEGPAAAWWLLPVDARYLRDHLVEHLLAADRSSAAEALATDLRWVQSRLEATGPLGPFADLGLLHTSRAVRLGRLVAQTAHLLTPTNPAHSLADILYARVDGDPDWGPQARVLARQRTLPALRPTWPLPDVPHPAMRRMLTGHAGPVLAVAIAPDGTWLASAEGLAVRIWDTATGQQRAELASQTGQVRAVAIAPDGTWLAIAEGPVVRIWDAAMTQQRAGLVRHAGRVNAVAIAPDGTWLATASDDHTVRIWDAKTGHQRIELTGHNAWVQAVAISPGGTWLASASDDRTVRIWDTHTVPRHIELSGHSDWVRALAIAPDGIWLASTEGWTVRMWNTSTWHEHAGLTGHTGSVHGLAMAPDGTWLASASDDRTVRIWDTMTGQHLATFTGHTGWVHAVAISPDGTWLASASDDGTVRIWDTTIWHEHAERTPHSGGLNAVATAPDGTWLATAGADRTVQVWDANTGDQRARLGGHTGEVRAIATAPDGTWIASASDDRTVRIWDAATGQQRAKAIGHTGSLKAVAISPDGTWIASAGDDRTVRIWDATTGERQAKLTNHTDSVNAVAISPDGTWIASAGDDRTVRICDTATGQQRAKLTGHTGSVRTVAISPDGTWIASAGDDRTLRLWETATRSCGAMTRVDGILTACAWEPRSRITVAGEVGLYRFELHPSVS